MRGYWNNPAETAKVLRDGWLRTGDVGHMDDKGYVTITDRKKDMILVSGFKVFPNEVEGVLAMLPGVARIRCGRHSRREDRRGGEGGDRAQGSGARRGGRDRALQGAAHRATRCRVTSSSANRCRSRRSARCCGANSASRHRSEVGRRPLARRHAGNAIAPRRGDPRIVGIAVPASIRRRDHVP